VNNRFTKETSEEGDELYERDGSPPDSN
jgi:hypothetical protein